MKNHATDKFGPADPATEFLRRISPQDLLSLGVEQMAYIRPASMNGSMVFAIHAADGTPLAFHADQATARALTRQNELEPLTLQ